MDKKVLNKHLEKLNEDIRNIQYQINSINQDIKKDKKQSYIEKRIDRLVNNYKMLNQKRQELVNISREEKRELQEKVLEIRKQVKDVCYKGSKDVSKQNIQLDEVVNNESKSEIYNKIDKWWINEIEIPITGNDIPEDYNRNEVCGAQAMILSIINSIVLGNKGAEYKEILDKLNGGPRDVKKSVYKISCTNKNKLFQKF